MRTRGSAKELEVKRRIAGNLLLEGRSRAEVARIVGTSWNSVNRWQQAISQGGLEALAAKPHPGRRRKLSPRQERQVLRILERGAQKAGFATDLWTCPRVAQAIERRLGIKYHDGHIWHLLRKWGWSCQKPQRRAREQDPREVQQWRRQKWPRIKKGA